MIKTPHGTWWDVMRIIAGTFIAAVGFRCLTFPNNIVSGGVIGISQIVNLLSGFPVGLGVFLMNVPLFIWARFGLGRRFVLFTGLAMAVNSVFLDLLEPVLVPLTSEPMLAAVYGGLINGLGWGIVYSTGYTGGGIDIPARFLRRKYPHINFNTYLMGFNLVVILAFALTFRNFESCMYTLICMYVTSKVEALILYGPINSRLCYIISDKSDELRHAITEKLGRGATILRGQGAWSGKDKQVILCAVKPVQLGALRRIVREIDVNSFLVISDARSVYGKGFENITVED